MAAAITAGAAAFVAVPALLPWAMGRREITRLRQAVAVLEDEARTPRRSAEDALRETTFARAPVAAPPGKPTEPPPFEPPAPPAPNRSPAPPTPNELLYPGTEKFGNILSSRLRLTALMQHEDAQGAPSTRVITIIRIHGLTSDQTGQDVLTCIPGWCHLRNEWRNFRLDRVVSLADPDTGEVFPSPAAWLAEKAGLPCVNAITSDGQAPQDAWSGFAFVVVTPRPVVPTKAVVEWQRHPGDIETFDATILEARQSGAGPMVGFKARATRRRSDIDNAWTGFKSFDRDMDDGQGVPRLTADGITHAGEAAIASWLATLPRQHA